MRTIPRRATRDRRRDHTTRPVDAADPFPVGVRAPAVAVAVDPGVSRRWGSRDERDGAGRAPATGLASATSGRPELGERREERVASSRD